MLLQTLKIKTTRTKPNAPITHVHMKTGKQTLTKMNLSAEGTWSGKCLPRMDGSAVELLAAALLGLMADGWEIEVSPTNTHGTRVFKMSRDGISNHVTSSWSAALTTVVMPILLGGCIARGRAHTPD